MAGDGADRTNEAPRPNGDATRRRRAWGTALILGGLVAGVFAAWLAGEIVRRRLESSYRPPRPFAVRPGPATRPEPAIDGPADLIDSPLAAVGLLPADGDPGGVAPPPKARRLYGFRRRLTDQAEHQARYEFRGTPDAAAEHYAPAFRARGFALLKDATDPTGRRVLVFEKAPAFATVALRRDRREPKMVIVVVTVVIPSRPGPRQPR